MKAYWGWGYIAPHILDLGTRWRWVVSFMPQDICKKQHKMPVLSEDIIIYFRLTNKILKWRPGFSFERGKDYTLGLQSLPTQPPIQRIPRTHSQGVKRPQHESNSSPPSFADVWNVWSFTSTSPIRLRDIVLGRRGTVYSTFNPPVQCFPAEGQRHFAFRCVLDTCDNIHNSSGILFSPVLSCLLW
jgi:hypothetical protein